MAIDFFKTTGDLRKYIADIDATANVERFEPHMRPVREKVLNIIGASTYSSLKTYYQDSYPGDDSKKDTAVMYIQGAMGNFMARLYKTFHAKGPDEKDRKYRYQEEKILEMHLDNAWTEMNNLLKHLESNSTEFPQYQDTDSYKERKNLFIKSANQFNKYYPINNSSYFYTNVVYIIKEVQLEIQRRIKNFPASLSEIDDDTQWIIGKAITFETMARACKRMDYTELPVGIRQDVMREVNNKARLNNYAENYLRVDMYNLLHEESEKWVYMLEFDANKDRNEGYYVPPADDNPLTEDDKFYSPGM